MKPTTRSLGVTKKKSLKPLSVTKNVVGLQTDDADPVGQNSSAQLARVVGLQTDVFVVTEARLRNKVPLLGNFCFRSNTTLRNIDMTITLKSCGREQNLLLI